MNIRPSLIKCQTASSLDVTLHGKYVNEIIFQKILASFFGLEPDLVLTAERMTNAVSMLHRSWTTLRAFHVKCTMRYVLFLSSVIR